MTNKELLTSEETRKTAFSPELAKRIGLNECIFLSQLQYWINMKEKNDDMSTFRDDRMWVYNTYRGWLEQFPYWSRNTLIRAISKLEKMGIILTGNYNPKSYDETKWYAIDYEQLDRIGKNRKTVTQNEYHPIPKMGSHHTQNGQTNTIEYNIENNNKEYILNGASSDARCCSDSCSEDVINYDILRKQIYKSLDLLSVYDEYSRNEVINIISYYFHRYKDYFGYDHPHIKQDVMNNVVCNLLDEPSGMLDISTEYYAPLIDQYFETDLPCDYHISHFMSGQIREFRNYEVEGV